MKRLILLAAVPVALVGFGAQAATSGITTHYTKPARVSPDGSNSCSAVNVFLSLDQVNGTMQDVINGNLKVVVYKADGSKMVYKAVSRPKRYNDCLNVDANGDAQ